MSIQPQHLYTNPLIVEGNLTSPIITSSQELHSTTSYSVQFIWTGATTPVGTFYLEGSNDDETFTQITDSIASVSGGSGTILVNVSLPAYGFVRVHYVPVSGSGGVVTCNLYGKQ